MNAKTENRSELETVAQSAQEFVTVRLAEQLLGVPVLQVHDVLKAQNLTPVPMAPDAVAGVMNLRGRIVTAIDLRTHLGFPPREDADEHMSVVVENNEVPYSLIIDTVGEVISVPRAEIDKNPVTLDPRIRDVSSGICRLEGELMVILDVDRLLDFEMLMAA